MKTAFYCDVQGSWRAAKRLTVVAAHYEFTPKRCQVRRPETKGKVERTIGYLDGNFWPRMEGGPLCLAELNARVMGWLPDIDTKPLAQFSESRNDRFLREKVALRPLPIDSCDVREQIPVAVNRESMIRYQTNSYSVPPEHIGQVLMLNVDPLSREAQLCGPQGTVRKFALAAAGARQRTVFPEDRQAMYQRWKQDRQRTARRRAPRRRPQKPVIEVEVRSPAEYDSIAEAMSREVCA